MIGETLGSYRIESQLGEGGMGAVYRARHVMLHRPAAIKVLLPQFSVNPEIVQRFFNEAKAATAIRHLGIVEIYDFGMLPSGVAYIAMELLRGESLGARMRKVRLPVTTALGIVRQMCGALGAAHDIGIVHRDLKPDNVFLVPDGEVASGERIKLLDFGIAKLAQDGQGMSSHKTRTGTVMGTPSYMAPEQCRGVKLDHRADIYSLGCMLYELVSGRPPFVGEGVGDILAAHIYEKPKPIDGPALSPGVAALLDRMLAKDPAQRPQTTGDVIAAIDDIVGGRVVTVAPATAIAAGSGPAALATTLSGAAASTEAPRGRRRVVPVALAGTGVAGMAVVAVLLGSHGAKDPVVASAATPDAVAATPPDAALAHALEPAIDAAPAPVHVHLDSQPSRSHVLRDGHDVGMTPYDTTLSPGTAKVVFVLHRDGYQDRAVDVTPTEDFTRTETLPPVRTVTHATHPAVTSGSAAPVAPAPSTPAPLGDDDAINPLRRHPPP